MDLVTLTIVALVVLLIVIVYSGPKKKDGKKPLPPGPAGLPLLGNALAMFPRDYMAYTRYKTFGDLCIVRIGREPMLILNSYRAVQEAFIGQADVFAGRPKAEFFSRITHDSGILFQDGPLWREHRRLILRLMRDFGLGRPLGETIVREECEALREKILAADGRPVDTVALFTSAINNVIARLTFSERCGSDDPNFRQFAEWLDTSLTFRMIDVVPLMFPIIYRIPPLQRLVEHFSQMEHLNENMHVYIREKLEQRRAKLLAMDPPPTDLDHASDISEAFLIEQAKQEVFNPGGHTFTEWQLVRNLFELFLAGTETTSTTLTWTMLLLSLHPDIQAKVQHEVEEKIGRSRMPAMTDRTELPYVSAVMDEVLRYSSLVASNVGHRCMRDTELMGFFIPKDILVATNLYGIHRDPALWAKPDEFYPEHFLTEDGEYRPSKYLIPFSIGRRACLGESLARMEFFLALVSLMQTFSVRLAESKTSIEKILLGKDGGVRRPLPHEIIFEKIDAV